MVDLQHTIERERRKTKQKNGKGVAERLEKRIRKGGGKLGKKKSAILKVKRKGKSSRSQKREKNGRKKGYLYLQDFFSSRSWFYDFFFFFFNSA